jgi:hypothetical protein
MTTITSKFLGVKGKDAVTGFSGTVIEHVVFLYGCSRLSMVGAKRREDGKEDSFIIDEQRFLPGKISLAFVKKLKFDMPFAMGDHVKDIITGMQGIVIGYGMMLDGNVIYGIEREGMDAKTNKPHEASWLYAARLTPVNKPNILQKAPLTDRPGGPRDGITRPDMSVRRNVR